MIARVMSEFTHAAGRAWLTEAVLGVSERIPNYGRRGSCSLWLTIRRVRMSASVDPRLFLVGWRATTGQSRLPLARSSPVADGLLSFLP